MKEILKNYWDIKLQKVKNNLEKNNFEAHIAQTLDEARDLVIKKMVEELQPKSISFGGSMTVVECGIYDSIKKIKNLEVIDTYDTTVSSSEKMDRRRRSLLVDLYITGTNALVENGVLVNLDGMGNRVAAITFGPKNVVIVVGRNKIVSDMEEAMIRVKEFAAPVNAIRLRRKTPCTKTAECENCSSPERICNMWSIIEKSAPKGRIKIILINQDIGF